MTNPLEQIKQLISEITNLDTSEILPDEELSEVVQGDVDVAVPRIVTSINQSFEIELDTSHISELVKDESHPLTIQELLSMIKEEVEL